MLDSSNAFVTPTFLRSVWEQDCAAFKDSPAEADLLARVRNWASRVDLGETSAEPAFIEQFFGATWGYHQSGQGVPGSAYTMWPKFPVPGAGAGGGMGRPDVALGHFGPGQPTPQVLCEYKDVRIPEPRPQGLHW